MAMAPQQLGIGIRRHFTEAGTDPYDTVEWERRDSRIPNFKDGGDAFFQADVEFPSSWSVNATNIVAQKYFRGTLGTPEREWSLRQVIDRVADTVTDWGIRDGYFADDAEAEAFRDELKFILVHQRAAFNSPVWFNIGVKGVPRQASACFILSVEDTMDGILNWYREEGTIFKGGSGSGINLSSIRSSVELLKGGGTASGPVSFMRGADASAGTIKCLHADTPITTDRGVVPIRDVEAGTRVLTRFGEARVDAVHDNGTRSLVRLRTSLGDELLCTPEHRFLVRGHDGEEWKQAGELRSDDYLMLDVSGQVYGAPQALEPVAREHHDEIGYNLPAELDENFALWLGWVYGDGSITRRRSATFVSVQIGDGDPELGDRYEALTRAVFGPDLHLHRSRHVGREDASFSVRFASTRIVRFLERNGLRKAHAAQLRVPAAIMSSPATVRAAFLAGLFEADGHVGNGYPWLSAVSSEFARDVHRLLASCGIPSHIGRIDDRRTALGRRPVHTVRIVGGEGVWRFAKLVGFVSERKHTALEAAVARKQRAPYETQWFLPHVADELSAVWQRSDDQLLRRAIAPYCRFAQPRRVSLLRARSLLERFPEALGGTTLARFALGDVMYVSARVEPAGEGPTFDLTVDRVHEYLVNGLVTHNSGGKTRRAAKMVILNADHPDVEEFIWCKAIEERKARALAEAGFDMDLDGKDSHSIQYQNANNSVRVTDEFMQAVLDDRDWALKAVTTGETVRTVRARDLMRQISESAWECADPGMQFDTTINRWHTASNTARINASNPCFTADSLVHTDKGLVRFGDLLDRVRRGETFGVYTHDATNTDAPAERLEITRPEAVMISGFNEIVRLCFSNGMELRCTPGHKVFTVNRGYVEAHELTSADEVKVLTLPAPAVSAEWKLPAAARLHALAGKGDKVSRTFALPEKWSAELGHYLGWLVGDGCISGDMVSTVYGSAEEQDYVLPAHRVLATELNDGVAPTPSVQSNGTVQLRQTRRVIARLFEALGVSRKKAAEKVVPEAVYQAPPEIVSAFLRGLFDADGCVNDGDKSRYVGLGSASRELLVGVQRLLSTFGVFSRIYATQGGGGSGFEYTRNGGTAVTYDRRPMFDLRITNRSIARFAEHIGFALPSKSAKLERLLAEHRLYEMKETVRLVERIDDGVELTFNLSEPRNHSYIVNGVVVRNCSEYMHLDNSACNLASINLLKYLDHDGNFDVEAFKHTVEVVFTAQEILVGNADYPTEKIAENTRAFRQLGLGYANLGALLMAEGMPYDSDEGRAWAAAITSLMTGHAYATSARTASRMGPFAGYAVNEEPTLDVLRMHRAEAAKIDEDLVPPELLGAAQQAWDEAVELGEQYGVRNSQATVLAPTGCLVGGTLVPTASGLVRLGSLGDAVGEQWQPLGVDVQTDEGRRRATQFYVNGVEPVVSVGTRRGYQLRGTVKHRVKVVDADNAWVWRRLGDLRPGDRMPLMLGGLVGEPQTVALAPLGEHMAWAPERHVRVPEVMTPELAEFVGYFMGDGSLHSKGLRLCVARDDFDVVEHMTQLAKALFGIEATLSQEQGYISVNLNSVRLAQWWEACGFAKRRPHEAHSGKGYYPHIPNAVLWSNDAESYRAFLRGLFEADGTVAAGYPSWTTTTIDFSRDVQTMMLALGFVTTRHFGTSGRGSRVAVLRLLNEQSNASWLDEVGFISSRKAAAVDTADHPQSARYDHIPVTRVLIDRVAPVNDRNRKVALMGHSRNGSITRRLASELFDMTGDAELGHLLGFFYDFVAAAELGDEEFTYDLSVPDNVTYVANGFVSHNTIGLMMDCDTTGIEPDLALTKAKKLVGGGTMFIVNQTVPRALAKLGYSDDEVAKIVGYIDEHKTIVGAPAFKLEHLPVFACSMGDNTIHYMGHVKMMGAAQPFLSGAISKTVNLPEEATVDDIEVLHVEAWRLGLKAVAIYRDNCKVGQPLSTQKKAAAVAGEVERIVETIIVQEPVRQKLPRKRVAKTFSFRVADCHGYVTVGEYEDGRPGEIFLQVAKQGSTLAGIMDAFAISVSHGLQYGVPLEAFVDMYANFRFEPAGMTDDPDIRFATSLVDYIFRRLAVEYLPYEKRAAMGILTIGERTQPTLPGVDEATTPSAKSIDLPAADRAPSASIKREEPVAQQREVVLCHVCGDMMQRAGSCYACPSCGSTSGCS